MYTEPRNRLINWVRRQLIGSPELTANGSRLLGVLPTERFPCGALYPISKWGEGVDPASEDVDVVDKVMVVAGESPVEPAVVRRYIPPSSLGFSFYIKGEDIRFQVLSYAVMYKYKKNGWKRLELISGKGNDEEFINISCPGKDQHQRFPNDEEKPCMKRVDVQWRQFADGWIVTVSLCNEQELEDRKIARDYIKDRAEKTLFEASLRCVIDAGDVGVYPRVDRSLLDPEEQEIELQYAHRHIYAIGHGCAANWVVKKGKVVEVRSETMPATEVPQMTADTGSGGEPVLSLARLAGINNAHLTILPELDDFISEYTIWVASQQANIASLPADDHETALRMVERMNKAVARMRKGHYPRPGEVSLAHRGVLFLDELPEFKKHVLEVLRQPLEDGLVTISRAAMSLTYPADLMLVAAMNPCPCGYLTDEQHQCTCSPQQIQRYRSRLSGPLLDRIDLHVEVPAVPYKELRRQRGSRDSATMLESIEKARASQYQRFRDAPLLTNSDLDGKWLNTFCPLGEAEHQFLGAAVQRLSLSARAYTRVLRIARTIADLEGTETLTSNHLAEAINYRTLDRQAQTWS